MQLIQTIAGFMLAARNIPIASALQTPAEFHLVSSSSDTALDNLYLSTKSTGPLNSNPVFRDPANAASFYLTNTTLNYDAPNKAPWALALLRGNAAQGNMEVSVNPSVTVAISTGFHINGDMHLYSESPSWGGWLGKSSLSMNILLLLALPES